MGAGTRATTTDLGTIFETDEQYGDAAAGEVYRAPYRSRPRRATSYTSTSRRSIGSNDVTPTTAPTPGALGDVLADHDVERSVIGECRPRRRDDPRSSASGARRAQRR